MGQMAIGMYLVARLRPTQAKVWSSKAQVKMSAPPRFVHPAATSADLAARDHSPTRLPAAIRQFCRTSDPTPR